MANENLKNALKNAGMTPEEFAAIIQVDPKSVQRWIVGTTTPYPRHRAKISRALDLPEHELWPAAVAAPEASGDGAAAPASIPGEVLGAWGRSTDDGAPDPISLLTGTDQHVDVLDPDGAFLSASGIVAALQNLTPGNVRIITTDRVQPSNEFGSDRFELRTSPGDPGDLAILRVGDTMLLALRLDDGEPSPTLALRRSTGGLFDRLSERFNLLWEVAAQRAQSVADPDPPLVPEPAVRGPAPRRWPRRPAN
jgi:Helix-turn-helix